MDPKYLLVVLMILFGMILLAADYWQSKSSVAGTFARNAYGEGSRTEELQVQMEDKEKVDVSVDIAEREYSKEETEQMFERLTAQMDRLILGENKSLNHVSFDLDLITETEEEPVSISWESDNYEVMDINGALIEDALKEEGTVVNLKATMTYTEDESRQAMYQCAVVVYPRTLSEEEAYQQMILRNLKSSEEEDRTSAVWTLPTKIGGKAVSYYRKMDSRGLVVLVMAVIIGILLYALKIQNQKQAEEERRKQLQNDYPEMISKLTMFLGAGMTVKKAWKKIVMDYETQKDYTGIHYVYEEMHQACNEMDSGVTESRSYVNFGRRCALQSYVRFGALLSQNLRKGTKGLVSLLKEESIQAFEERKANARKQGEEAGTKLLIPMFLMLAIVLVIVIVPAFLSMQI